MALLATPQLQLLQCLQASERSTAPAVLAAVDTAASMVVFRSQHP